MDEDFADLIRTLSRDELDFIRGLPPGQVPEVLRKMREIRQASQPRAWRRSASNKQLDPSDPKHHLPWTHPKTGETYRCSDHNPHCTGPSLDWRFWLMLTGRGVGKAVSMDTVLITPDGWKEMGNIHPGDRVFDESGQPCQVTATFDLIPEEAYRVSFSDGTHIDACGDHQWVTWTHAERKAFLRSPHEDTSEFPENWPAWRLKKIPGSYQLGEQVVAEALELHRQGVSARKIAVKLGVARNALARHLKAGHYVRREARVYPDSPGPRVRTTREIAGTLTYGNRGDANHCIPVCGPLQFPEVSLPVDPYVLGYWLGDGGKSSSVITIGNQDAEAVLQALEGCGERIGKISSSETGYTIYGLVTRLCPLGVINNKHVPPQYMHASAEQRLALLQGLMDADGGWTGSMAEFCNTRKPLADAVMELARSLGQKPVMAEGRAMLNGKDCGPRWRVTWTPTVNVFRLPRKAARFCGKTGAQSLRKHHRMIISAERIDPVPMRCLTVDSPNSMYLAGDGMIPTHNTYAGANWVIEMALSQPDIWVAVCAPTYQQVRDVCFVGPSGILKHMKLGQEYVSYNKNNLQIVMANGSVIQGFSPDNPDTIRGANLTYAWVDELSSFVNEEFYYEGLLYALRMPRADGGSPRMVITTTPKSTHIVREMVDLTKSDPAHYHLTRAFTWENPALSDKKVEELRQRKFTDPLRYRQEMEGELVLESDNAFFQLVDFDKFRIPVEECPVEFREVVIGVDPASTSNTRSDETGIVVIGTTEAKHSYVLADLSGKYDPDTQMSVIQNAYYRYEATEVVVEKNVAGDYFPVLMQKVDPSVPIRQVQARKGKTIRAHPVSHLNKIGRIHMVGADFDNLEKQLAGMTPDQNRDLMHDDRADAFVWAMLWLTRREGGNWQEAYGFSNCKQCGQMVNFEKDEFCHNCQMGVIPDNLQLRKGERRHEEKAAVRWWKAYQKTCRNGHDYPMKLAKCPECGPSPETYMSRVLALSQAQGNTPGIYTGKDWLAGRKWS